MMLKFFTFAFVLVMFNGCNPFSKGKLIGSNNVAEINPFDGKANGGSNGGGNTPIPTEIPTEEPTTVSPATPTPTATATPTPSPTSGGGSGGGNFGNCDDLRNAWALNDTYLCVQWHLSNRGQQIPKLPSTTTFFSQAGANGVDIKGFNTLKTQKGSATKGYVTDNGTWKHPDLVGNLIGGYNNCSHSEDGQGKPPSASDTHGTMVAGIIAAVGNNSMGVAGVASLSKFYMNNMVSSCQGVMSTSEQISALNPSGGYHYWSGSWGVPACSGHLARSQVAANFDAFSQGATQKNISYSKANGNGWSQCQEDGNGEPYGSNHGVMHIAALDNQGVVASYSTRGANLVLSCYAGYGGSGASPGIVTTYGTANDDNRYTANMNGTSAATPCTSGAVAVLRGAFPNLKWYDYAAILYKSALPAAGETQTSSSTVSQNFINWETNAKGYRHSYHSGFGTVNLDGAMTVAQNYSPLPAMQLYQPSSSPLLATGGGSIPAGSCSDATFDNTTGSDFTIYSAEINTSITGASYKNIALWLSMSDGKLVQLKQWTNMGGTGLNYGQYFKAMAPFALNAKGTWKLKVCVRGTAAATFSGAKLNFYGFSGANIIPPK